MFRFCLYLTSLFFCLSALPVSSNEIISDAADILNSHKTPLANTEGEPSSLIHGCVNVITGDFIDFQTDLTMAGSNPLLLERYYCSSDHACGSLFHGWNQNIWGGLSQQFSTHHNHVVTKGLGKQYVFKERVRQKKDSVGYSLLCIDDRMLRKGITNIGNGKIGAQTNIKNVIVEVERGSLDKREPLVWSVCEGDGTKNYYNIYDKRNEQKPESFYFLYKREFPNGCNQLFNNYFDQTRAVVTQNKLGKIIDSLQFTIFDRKMYDECRKKNTDPFINVTAPDGRFVTYRFKIFKGNKSIDKEAGDRRLRLFQVERQQAPCETYVYEDSTPDYFERIVRKERPDGRYLAVEYYKTKNKTETGKVKCLQTPAGINAQPVTLYRFDYADKGLKKKPFGEGETIVHDALNHKTVYKYSLDTYRLSEINKYQNEDQLYSKEKLFWGETDSNEETQIIAHALENNCGEILFCRHYRYDLKGNVEEDSLYGNITGNNLAAPQMQGSSPQNNGCECYTLRHKYSYCSFNLLLETYDGNLTTQYDYHPHTNLLKSKFILADGQIRIREFFDYDDNAALRCHIIDDGFSNDRNNFSGITQQTITKYVNREEAPAGLPEVIEEYALDLQTGGHMLLSKTVNHMDKCGQVIARDKYDSRNIKVASEAWIYNHYGQVFRYTNPFGQETEYHYDWNGNKTYEKGPRTDAYKEYQYDLCNRLIKESDEQQLTATFNYDYMGNRIASIDIYGQETRYEYDAFGRMIKMIQPFVSNEKGESLQPVALYSYDLMSHRTAITDPLGNTTLTKYTITGKPFFKQYPDGSIERCEYTLKGELKKQIDRDGSFVIFTYDYLSRPIKIERFSATGESLAASFKEYNAFHLTQEIDPEGHITHYAYDPAGQLVRKECEDGLTHFIYDFLGRESEVHAYYGCGDRDYICRTKKYDLLDRIIEETEQDGAGHIFSKLEYAYDADGNRTEIKTTNEAGIAATTSTYDSRQQLILQINPLGHATKFHYRYDYHNSQGWRVPYSETVDPLGRKTIFIQDALNRNAILKKENALGQLLQQTEYLYDLAGNLRHEIDSKITLNKPIQKISTMRFFDSLGRVVRLIEAASTTEERTTTFEYDPAGRIICCLKPSGKTLHYAYDAMGRLADFQGQDFHYRYSYDRNDNPLVIEDLMHRTSTMRRYDSNDRLINETLGNGLTIAYQYDRLGRITRITLPDNSFVDYFYDPLLKHIKRKTEHNTYQLNIVSRDPASHITEVQLLSNFVRYKYDLLDRRIVTDAGCWKETLHTFDPAGNLLMRTLEDPLGKLG